MDDPIPRILAKLKEVRKRGLKSFGCESHKFSLQAPLSEEAVRDFERQHGITLPDEFRRFVLEAGGSGAGPYYGLQPMDWWWNGFGSSTTECPMYPGMPVPQLNDPLYDRMLDGTLSIVQQGCSSSTVLVVTGPYRGRLVNYDAEDGAPYFTRDTGFLAYYERWLDEILAGWDTGWFGFGMPGDARRMLEILNSPGSTGEERYEALRTVTRIPRLDDQERSTVLARLADSEARVRAMSAALAARHRISGAESLLRELCGDPDAAARCAALKALHTLRTNDWSTRARHALQDPAPEVYHDALYLLTKAKLLTRQELEPLIADADAGKRAAAIRAWGRRRFRVSSAPWRAARMDDADPAVRRSVIDAATAAGDRKFLPFALEMAGREGGEFDMLAKNFKSRVHILPVIHWILGSALGIFLLVLAWRQPWVLVPWAFMAGYFLWKERRRRRLLGL